METVSYNGLEIVLARLDLEKGASWISAPQAGLWASVLVQGAIEIDSGAAPLGRFQNGDCHCYFADDMTETRHSTPEKTNLVGIFVRVDPDQINATLGDDWAAGYLENPFRKHVCSGDPTIAALAWQMLGCPMPGNQRRLYIAGKALELLSMLSPQPADAIPTGARAFEVKRAHDARAILLADLQSPPTIPELAREVGMNARRLSEVFRDVFGMTPYALLKVTRLDSARMSLESDAMTVAQIAHRFGYQPAHFSTEFRRHFGIAPAALLKQRRHIRNAC